MVDFKQVISESLKSKIEDMTIEEIKALLEIPPNKDMGDYAFPCFKLAKIFRKSPNMIAEEIAKEIELTDEISKVINLGAYVNFFVNKGQLAKKVINQILTEKENYGKSDFGGGKNVVIDYSSPNIAKPFHIGHIRTTVIGNALYKIYDSQGYNTIRINHLGDYGTQFGMVALEEGTMSTRKGRVVFLEDVLHQAIDKTKEIIEEKNPDAENIDEIAKEVGVGAVVFQELSNSRIKDYTFSWERTLSFEGETGPYVQYTHARCCAVERKANTEITSDINFDLLSDEEASDVLKVLETFNKSIMLAMSKNEPHIVTRFVLDLAQAFNKFYHNSPILVDDEELRKARLALVECTRQTIENALKLLGMQAPIKM